MLYFNPSQPTTHRRPMTATECLAWCKAVRGRFPDDFQAAFAVLNWLADKARTEAKTPDDFEAIDAAVEAAKELLG